MEAPLEERHLLRGLCGQALTVAVSGARGGFTRIFYRDHSGGVWCPARAGGDPAHAEEINRTRRNARYWPEHELGENIRANPLPSARGSKDHGVRFLS